MKTSSRICWTSRQTLIIFSLQNFPEMICLYCFNSEQS